MVKHIPLFAHRHHLDAISCDLLRLCVVNLLRMRSGMQGTLSQKNGIHSTANKNATFSVEINGQICITMIKTSKDDNNSETFIFSVSCQI